MLTNEHLFPSKRELVLTLLADKNEKPPEGFVKAAREISEEKESEQTNPGMLMSFWFVSSRDMSHDVVVDTIQKILSSQSPVVKKDEDIVPEWDYSARFFCKSGNAEFETTFCYHGKNVLVMFCYTSQE